MMGLTAHNSTQGGSRARSPKFFALVALRAYYTKAKNFAWLRPLHEIEKIQSFNIDNLENSSIITLRVAIYITNIIECRRLNNQIGQEFIKISMVKCHYA
jgi:hypothetical protein